MAAYIKPTHLVLGPGGVKGLYFLGLLHYFENANFLDNIKGYSGSSVGAMIALLKTCGYTSRDIIMMAIDTNLFNDFYNVNFGSKLAEMKTNFGIVSNSNIRDKLRDAVIKKYDRVVTMHELHLITGIDLQIVTFNRTKETKLYINHLTCPDMDVVTAVLLSINIPLLFYRMTYKDDEYIDGGFCDPLPITPFDNGINQILAVYIHTGLSQKIDNSSWFANLTGYLHQIVTTSIHCLRDYILATSSSKVDFIELRSTSTDTTGVSLSVEEKTEMIFSGMETARLYLEALGDKSSDEFMDISAEIIQKNMGIKLDKVFRFK